MRDTVIRFSRTAGLLRPLFRLYELGMTVSPRVLYHNTRYLGGKSPDGLPIPPLKLIVEVAGTADISGFLSGGLLTANIIRDVLSSQGCVMEQLEAILDFGCGCGRVARHWQGLKSTCVHGCDYNPRLIDWCDRNLPFGEFATNQLEPPLSYETGQFDLVYAISVFTHLTVPLQIAWMAELSRIIRPGGCLLITTHGDHYLDMLMPAERQQYAAGEVVVRYEEVEGTNMCSAFHPLSFVRDDLARALDLVAFVPMGARGNAFQDLYLLRKPHHD